MAQQVFNQWAPVAKAHNEQGQEVYLPFAGIHAQTRDGKDEVIVGAGNMVWTGSMWVPVSAQNRLPVEATLSGRLPPSAMEIYGPTAAQRPPANSVPVGAVYMAVNTGEIWQSNGTNWVVLA